MSSSSSNEEPSVNVSSAADSGGPSVVVKLRVFPKFVQECITLELCAGSAMLSACLQLLGFQSLAYDHTHNRHVTRHSVINLDLSDASSVDIVCDIIRNHAVVYVHIAPPCGTASKARNRPISEKLKAQGVPEPKPLRSETCPAGLPNLSETDQKRVSKANAIYDLTVAVATLCAQLGVLCSVENPASSFFWLYPGIPQLLQQGFQDADFAGCMHGGTRNRICRWRSLNGFLLPLSCVCDGNHKHEAWKMTKVNGQ